MNVREPNLIVISHQELKEESKVTMEVTLFLEIHYNLPEQESKTLEGQPCWSEGSAHVETPWLHLLQLCPSLRSIPLASRQLGPLVSRRPFGRLLVKNPSLLNPRVACPAPNLGVLLVRRPFCRLHVYTYKYQPLRETKLPSSSAEERTAALLWLALFPVFPHVRSNQTSYFCILLVLAKII